MAAGSRSLHAYSHGCYTNSSTWHCCFWPVPCHAFCTKRIPRAPQRQRWIRRGVYLQHSMQHILSIDLGFLSGFDLLIVRLLARFQLIRGVASSSYGLSLLAQYCHAAYQSCASPATALFTTKWSSTSRPHTQPALHPQRCCCQERLSACHVGSSSTALRHQHKTRVAQAVLC